MKKMKVTNPRAVIHFTNRHIGGEKCAEIGTAVAKILGMPTACFDSDVEVTIIEPEFTEPMESTNK